MLRKLTHSFVFAIFVALIGVSFSFAEPMTPEAKDQFCKSHLLGTMSQETCMAVCAGGKGCKSIQTHKAKDNKDISEDVECFGCAAGQSCYELGLMPKFPDCMMCEMNPKKVCVSSIPVKNPLGFGPGAIPLPKTLSGEQCYDCIDRPNTCKDIWPASSPLAACQAGCKNKNEACVPVGVNPADGTQCFECKKTPFETCKDLGLLSQAQCNTCPADSNCFAVPFAKTKNNEQCFKCFPKNGPPPPPPPPEETCEMFGWRAMPGDCSADELKMVEFLGSRAQLDCYKCVKDQCHEPGMHLLRCKAECEAKGGKCIGMTRTKNDPECYYCSMPERRREIKSCQDAGMFQTCTPFPCSAGDECVMEPLKLTNGKTIECANCIPGDINPRECQQFRAFPHCAFCYQSGLPCNMVKFKENPDLWCAECVVQKQCADDGAMPGTCTQTSCQSNMECVNTQDGCHACKNKPKCEDIQGLYTAADCGGACHGESEACEAAFAAHDDPLKCYECVKKDRCEDLDGYYAAADCGGQCSQNQTCEKDPADITFSVDCWHCVDKPIVEDQCPAGTTKGTCPASCSTSQKCNQLDNGCYQCVEKTCDDYALLADCSECSKRNEDCMDVSPQPGLTCKGCKTKTAPPPPECPQGTSPGACTSSSCSSAQECTPAGENCHRCSKKRQTCVDMGLNYGDECIKACEPQGGTCSQKTSDDFGQACWECQKPQTVKNDCTTEGLLNDCGDCPAGNCEMISMSSYKFSGMCFRCRTQTQPPPPQCDQGFAPGVCPGSCTSEQNCVQAGECYQCQEKPKTAKRQTCVDMGLNYGDECVQACQAKGGTCFQKTSDDFGQACWECRTKDGCKEGYEKGPCYGAGIVCGFDYVCEQDDNWCHRCVHIKDLPPPQCDYGFSSGTCPGNCSSNQECVQAGECYQCKEKPHVAVKTCEDYNLISDQNSCYNRCRYGTCVRADVPEKDLWCYECKETSTISCKSGFEPGFCSKGVCGDMADCVADGNCMKCVERPRTTTGGEEITDGGGAVTTGGGGSGVTTGGGGQTGSKKTCFEYDLNENCMPCMWQSKDCVIVTPEPGLNCRKCEANPCRPNLTKDECGKCYWDDLDCKPVDLKVSAGMTRARDQNVPQCYECVGEDACEDYGLVCNCSSCRPGTVCAPAKQLEDSGKTCFACIRPTSIEVTYVVIIIETPYARYVLKDNPAAAALGKIGGFNPSKIMALAKVDSAAGAMNQIKGMLGGANPLSMATVSLESLSETLSKGLSSGGKFGDNCFKDFKETDFEEKEPTTAATSKDKGQPAEFGKDPMKEMSTGGPIIACGEQNGQKALAIFDANGSPISLLSKENIKQNPNAVKEAVSKAQGLSDQIMSLREGGLSGIIKKAASFVTQKAVAQVRELVEEKKKVKKGKEPQIIEPNDPLYKSPDPEKTKKLLGVIGSNSDGNNRVKMGSMLRTASDIFDSSTKTMQEWEKEGADDQWGLQKIGYLPKSDPNSAWNLVDTSKPNVIVAVIDSGLDLTHPDGPEYIWKNEKETAGNGIDDDKNGYVDDDHGWNFLDDNNDLSDFRGHGTIVAGIIAAKADNGMGIAGINPGAVIMPLKVADAEGKANSFNISRAVYYAVHHGARVINISMGGHEISKLEQAAVNFARAQGVFVVVASGNVNENISLHGPASDLGAFSVGAIDMSGTRSTISNWGPNNGVLGPGEQIYSLFSKDTKQSVIQSIRKAGYWKQSGTSFSTPMVAATASLMLTLNPNLTPEEIEAILTNTATDMYEPGWDGMSGGGLLNATEALKNVSNKNVLVAKISGLRINRDDRKGVRSVDVFATVGGPIKEFVVELGKGKNPGRFDQVPGVLTKPANNDWVSRIPESMLRGSKDWVVRLKITTLDGQILIAQADLVFDK